MLCNSVEDCAAIRQFRLQQSRPESIRVCCTTQITDQSPRKPQDCLTARSCPRSPCSKPSTSWRWPQAGVPPCLCMPRDYVLRAAQHHWSPTTQYSEYQYLRRIASAAQLTFDLGNLTAFDPSPLNEEEARTNPDGCCQQLATIMTQALVERLFALPSQPVEGGRVAQLPPPSTPLPRAKPLPKPRAPTKWELFAQRKGIQKQKRSKLVLDEGSGEWRRRYGYKKANDPDEVPIIEASAGDQVQKHYSAQHAATAPCQLSDVAPVQGGEDPFSQQQAAKQKSIKAQGKRQLGNLKAQAKAEGRPGRDDSSLQVQDYGARRQQMTSEVHPCWGGRFAFPSSALPSCSAVSSAPAFS